MPITGYEIRVGDEVKYLATDKAKFLNEARKYAEVLNATFWFNGRPLTQN